jgi:ubiquinone/menaquinone biosynthesis C-methylase UbiE
MILYAALIVSFLIYVYLAHVLDYKILKEKHLKSKEWDLNISCGDTNVAKINADIIQRDIPNFMLINDIYNLPFKNKEFENVVSSHTIEHVDNPDEFFKELKRISKNVTLILPPIWDIASMFWILEHKWLFLTFKTKHENNLPKKIKMPYDFIHNLFGQRIK